MKPEKSKTGLNRTNSLVSHGKKICASKTYLKANTSQLVYPKDSNSLNFDKIGGNSKRSVYSQFALSPTVKQYLR